MSSRCNPYGAENRGGHSVVFGGLLDNPVDVQSICENPSVHRFRWRCACGHNGSIVSLCERHVAEFNGDETYRDQNGRTQEIPFNIRRDVRACPRCASLADTPQEQHKCKVRLVMVS